ncbi:hypothetical protein HYV49_03665 [Candidatus Pacearchaeota archaeon]|nr:hypothetical protein [Candidatus Pacearchaeota archaeon]
MRNKINKINKSGSLMARKVVIILIIVILVAGFWMSFFNKDKILGYVINENKRPDPIDTLTVPLDNTDETNEITEEKLKETEEYQSFTSSCGSAGGGVLVSIGSSSATYECYQKSDDAGTNCRTDADCGSYNCNLQTAVDSGICVLIKTDKNFTEETYIYTYNCASTQPGLCGEIPRNTPIYYWVGDNVIEYGNKTFPEEDEFQPA